MTQPPGEKAPGQIANERRGIGHSKKHRRMLPELFSAAIEGSMSRASPMGRPGRCTSKLLPRGASIILASAGPGGWRIRLSCCRRSCISSGETSPIIAMCRALYGGGKWPLAGGWWSESAAGITAKSAEQSAGLFGRMHGAKTLCSSQATRRHLPGRTPLELSAYPVSGISIHPGETGLFAAHIHLPRLRVQARTSPCRTGKMRRATPVQRCSAQVHETCAFETTRLGEPSSPLVSHSAFLQNAG